MEEHYYAVIMAGGRGTRLWPVSRQGQPKQMLHLLGDRSLFQMAVDRLEGVFPKERIFVVTVEEQATKLQQQVPGIPAENYLLEPMPRGTASVVGLAGVALQQRDPEAVMAILTADHHIGNEVGFRSLLGAAYDVSQDGYLVTLGITPTFPSTGYGYIQRGEPLGSYRGMEVYRVLRFTEKPDEDRAREMLQGGDHTWNSGMFVWRVDHIMEEFEDQMPELYEALQEISQSWGTPQRPAVVERLWAGLQKETIDYGVMEGAQDAAVIPAEGLNWNDVGSWDSLFDVLPADEDGNIIRGASHLGLDTEKTLVYVEKGERFVVTIGVEDLVVVDAGQVLLICKLDEAQRVREVVHRLEKTNPTYL
jgi:mannose-1-phosphate guanylyltransferase